MSDKESRSNFHSAGYIETVELKAALEERYLTYALSTVMHRALPDVRDGLKPVHRRILHAMRLLHLKPNQGYAKCARIVGDVMGKFHPHGDISIYEALVRLAQDFSARYPLVDGQGNFGNIDGDSAAAMRYTEARMSDVSMFLMEGIAENAIDFRPTYNEKDEEPVVLPSAFPNLLANGSSGIAVGMATSIPPHNIIELCDAAQYLIAHPTAITQDLLSIIKGPDFPTGGVLVEPRKQIALAYQTGRGSFRLRARWHREEKARGTYVIIVTEIPYQVQKSRLIKKTAELLVARKLPLLEDIRDESDAEIRIVLAPKNHMISPSMLMESVFKLTDFETRIPLNMNALSMGRVPCVLSLHGILQQWLDHRIEVLHRRFHYRLEKITQQLEILHGSLIAYLNLDDVLHIIRTEAFPKLVLIEKFGLDNLQAESVLNMRLRSLQRLEEAEIRQEIKILTAEKEKLSSTLADKAKQWQTISDEISRLRKKFSNTPELGTRRTIFDNTSISIYDLEDIQQSMIKEEAITVVLSQKGWLRTIKGHLADYSSLSFKEEDELRLAFFAMTTDKILFVSTGGKFYTLSAKTLPRGRGHGEPFRLLIDLEQDQDILTAFVHVPQKRLLVASYCGYGFLINENDTLSTTRKGKQVMTVKTPDRIFLCKRIEGDHIAVIGENCQMIIFPLEQIPEMTRGRGVRLQKYSRDGGLSDIISFSLSKGLSWKSITGKIFKRSASELTEWFSPRATNGRMLPRSFLKSGKFSQKHLKV